MPDGERGLMAVALEMARMAGELGAPTSTTQAEQPAPELSGLGPRANTQRGLGGFTGSKGFRNLLLEQRADLVSSIAESRDRLRHIEAALAAVDASPEVAEALERAFGL